MRASRLKKPQVDLLNDMDRGALTFCDTPATPMRDIRVMANGVTVALSANEFDNELTCAEIAEAICKKINAAGGNVKREGSTISPIEPEQKNARMAPPQAPPKPKRPRKRVINGIVDFDSDCGFFVDAGNGSITMPWEFAERGLAVKVTIERVEKKKARPRG